MNLKKLMYCNLYRNTCIGKFCSASKDNYEDCYYIREELKMEEKMITITEKEYDSLLEDSQFLCALQGAGVDNWSGYGYAQEMIEEWDNEE